MLTRCEKTRWTKATSYVKIKGIDLLCKKMQEKQHEWIDPLWINMGKNLSAAYKPKINTRRAQGLEGGAFEIGPDPGVTVTSAPCLPAHQVRVRSTAVVSYLVHGSDVVELCSFSLQMESPEELLTSYWHSGPKTPSGFSPFWRLSGSTLSTGRPFLSDYLPHWFQNWF